jgi:hypothetical protein
VLTVAPNGNAVVTSNNADVFIYNGSSVTILSDGINHVIGATAAAFSPDSGKLFVTTSAGDLWFEVPGVTPTKAALGGTPSDISFLPSGTIAIAATSSGLRAVQTCDQTIFGGVAAGAFDHVVGVPTTTTGPVPAAVDSVVATLSPDIHRVDFTITGTGTPPGCPFNLAAADNTATTAGFTANELVLSTDSTHAFVISGTQVIDYNIASNSFTSVALSTVNGTPDSKSGGVAASGALYVGGGPDNSVHVITAGVDGTPIGATIPADLVVAKSR